MELEIAGGDPREIFSCSCNDRKSHAATRTDLDTVACPSQVGIVYN